MPVHPEVAKLLAALPASAELSQYSPEVARRRLVSESPIGVDSDAGVATEDFEIEGPNGPIPLRVYRPVGVAKADMNPVIIHLHGGGFVTGSLDIYDANAREIAKTSNCVVVGVGYRLAPEHPFPQGLEDCYAATCWVAERGREKGLDPDRIAIGGSSAGATLAATVCMMARDRGGPRIAFQFLVYPAASPAMDSPSVDENADGYWFTKATLKWCWSHYFARPEDAQSPYASLLENANHADLPPALVITAEYDPLRDEGERYAAAMAAQGVDVRLSRYYGMIHGFFIFRDTVAAGNAAVNEVATAVATALGVSPRINAQRDRKS